MKQHHTPKIQQVGNLVDDTNIHFKNPQRGRIYSPLGLSPTMQNWAGGVDSSRKS